MQHFLDQATENENFIRSLDSSFSNEYFDWKTTILFYIALHWMKAFLEKCCNVNNIESHEEIRNYYRSNSHIMPKHVYAAYKALYDNSCVTRYTGVLPTSILWKARCQSLHTSSRQHLEVIRMYMKKRKVLL